jgi:putative transposase
VSRFRFVEDHRGGYDVRRLCRLVEVSRSGYYAWRRRAPSPRAVADAALSQQIGEIHTASRRTYGRVRVCGQLRRRGLVVNHKRVGRLMRQSGLVGLSNRKRWRRGGPARVLAPAPDLLERDFSATRPNERWVADISEFETSEGRLYVAGVLDLYSRRIVGWSMASRRPAELVVDALAMAIARRQPDGEVIHHADLGSQYTSMRFCDAAADHGVRLSFGSVGDAFDNAAMEAFWSTLKRELRHIHGHQIWPTRRALQAALFDYIEVFYNRARHQARLEHRTPADYEAATAAA